MVKSPQVQRGKLTVEQFLQFARSRGQTWHSPGLGHCKNGPVNYYPTTGSIFLDGDTSSAKCSPEEAIQKAEPSDNGETVDVSELF